MATFSFRPALLPLAPDARREAAGWAAGAGFTLLLFLVLARIEQVSGPAPDRSIADLPVMSLPLEAPPPRLTEPPPPDEAPPPLTAIETAAADSTVHIVAVPPDLAALLPEQTAPPRASVSLNLDYAELKPRAGPEADLNHIYQQSEVDQRPRALVRVAPQGTGAYLGGASALHLRLLVLIDRDGHAESARVIRSSGNAEFDVIMMNTLKASWLFSPAVKRGRKVRCLVEQRVDIQTSDEADPFSLQ